MTHSLSEVDDMLEYDVDDYLESTDEEEEEQEDERGSDDDNNYDMDSGTA